MIESFVHKCKENFQKFVIIPIHVFIGMVRNGTFHSFFYQIMFKLDRQCRMTLTAKSVNLKNVSSMLQF